MLAHSRRDRRCDVAAPSWGCVEHDGIWPLQLTGDINGILHRDDIEEARARWNDDEGRHQDRLPDHLRDLGRRVDEGPFETLAPGLVESLGDCARARPKGWVFALAELMPGRNRALRIAIHEKRRARSPACMNRKMCGQRALPRPAFARCENKDIHG